jgi:tape measure domain-containing protein
VVKDSQRAERDNALKIVQALEAKQQKQQQSIAIERQIAEATRQTAIASKQSALAIEESARKARDLQAAGNGAAGVFNVVRGAIASAVAALGVIGTIQIGGDLVKAANDAELVSRRIQAVAGSFGEVAGVYDIAAKASRRFAIGQTEAQSSVSNLYNRLRPMGVTLEQIETMFMGVNKASQLGGLTALDTSEAFRQLGQAMGSGRLQGDELRSLGERMPAVLQAVAKVMGVTVGEVKALGSEGKVTTDILIKAAEELNKLTPPEPTALARYKQAVDDLATTLAIGLEPVITPTIQGLTKVAQALVLGAGWLKANKEGIKAVASETGAAILVAAKLAAVTGVVVVAFKALNAALQTRIALQKASILVETLAASLSPKRAAFLLASLAAGAVAVAKVEEKIRGIFSNLPDIGAGASGIAKSAGEIAASIDTAGSGLAGAKTAADALAMSAEERAKLEKILADEVERVAVGYQQQSAITANLAKNVESRTKAAEDILSVEQAQIGVAKAYLDNRLAVAKTDYERRQITLEIIELERKGAQAQYAATMAQIQGERELANLRVIEAENRFRQAIEELRIARELGIETAKIRADVEAARSGLKTTAVETVTLDRSLSAREKVAGLNLEATNVALAGRAAQAPRGTRPGFNQFGNVFEIYPTQISGGIIPQFAKGGYVTSPTIAEIGEGGEPEYVVPESKAKGFAANILGGSVGRSAISSASSNTGGYVTDKYGNRWSTNPADYRGKSISASAFDQSEEIGSPRWQIKMANRKLARGSSLVGGGAKANEIIKVVNNIQTGPVQRRSDGDSVSFSDLEMAVASAVEQTLAQVQKTARQPSFRRRTGSR